MLMMKVAVLMPFPIMNTVLYQEGSYACHLEMMHPLHDSFYCWTGIAHLIRLDLGELTYLNLSWCESISHSSLASLFSQLSSLRVAKLRNMNITDVTLAALVSATSHLEVLDIARSEVL